MKHLSEGGLTLSRLVGAPPAQNIFPAHPFQGGEKKRQAYVGSHFFFFTLQCHGVVVVGCKEDVVVGEGKLRAEDGE